MVDSNGDGAGTQDIARIWDRAIVKEALERAGWQKTQVHPYKDGIVLGRGISSRPLPAMYGPPGGPANLTEDDETGRREKSMSGEVQGWRASLRTLRNKPAVLAFWVVGLAFGLAAGALWSPINWSADALKAAQAKVIKLEIQNKTLTEKASAFEAELRKELQRQINELSAKAEKKEEVQ